MIKMIEPTDPEERRIAIRMCRANKHLDADTGAEIDDHRASMKQWLEIADALPYAKWIWMWNHGRAEWDPNYKEQP